MAKAMEGKEEALADLEQSIIDEQNLRLRAIEADAKANTPVRSGHLQSSYVVTELVKLGDIGAIENTATYAAYIEYGTEKIKAVMMLNNAADREMNKK